jgi:hypothetical protein
MIKEYINKIGNIKDSNKMDKLGEMLEKLIYNLKDEHEEEYEKYKTELYELAYGKKISREMAVEWVNSMKPLGEYWTIDQTTNAMQTLGYNLDSIDFYVAANMIMNDYSDLLEEEEELALKMAYDWLNDEDAKDNKLYCYWKHIVKK